MRIYAGARHCIATSRTIQMRKKKKKKPGAGQWSTRKVLRRGLITLAVMIVAGLTPVQSMGGVSSDRGYMLHVMTGAATEIRGSSTAAVEVELEGNLYPKGHPTRYWFDWGKTARYGHHTRPVFGEGYEAFGAENVSATLTSLRHGTLFHYRLVGKNSSGKAFGRDSTFRTARR